MHLTTTLKWKQCSILLLFSLLSIQTFGQVTWTGAIDDDWFLDGNWDSGMVPTPGDEVIIPITGNDPILAGATSIILSLHVEGGASLTIEFDGLLEMDGSFADAILNDGLILNEGEILIGETFGVGDHGIKNTGTLTNDGGTITIIGTGLNGGPPFGIADPAGIQNDGATAEINNINGGIIDFDFIALNGIHNKQGSFNNDGTITMATTCNVIETGIINEDIFNNQTNGVINIDGTGTDGIEVRTGTFTNHGAIIMGFFDFLVGDALDNKAIFINEATGTIDIDSPTDDAIDNEGINFTNRGTITIGAVFEIGDEGIENEGTFTNESTGVIHIDDIPDGSAFTNEGTTNNHGDIFIGANAYVDYDGIGNYDGTFTNETTGRIEIDDTGFDGLYVEVGTMTNKGTVIIGANAEIGGSGVLNYDLFNNEANATLEIDNTFWGDGIHNDGVTVTNGGTIKMGSKVQIGNIGIINIAQFTNEGTGIIEIDDTWADGILNDFFMEEPEGGIGAPIIHIGIFDNFGTVKIGANTSIGDDGVQNYGDFNNKSNSTLEIDDTSDDAIDNHAAIAEGAGLIYTAKFINDGTIRIGSKASIGDDGIINRANFFNNSGCSIYIDDTIDEGIENTLETFMAAPVSIGNIINEGAIHIGASSAIGEEGVINEGTFTNGSSGVLNIDQTTYHGILNIGTFENEGTCNIAGISAIGEQGLANAADFFNSGLLEIGKNAAIGFSAIDNTADIDNEACGTIRIFDELNNTGTFQNSGLFSVNTATASVPGTFTNDGIIEDVQDSFPIGGITNNDVVVKPISGMNNCHPITNVLIIGGANSFSFGSQWYKEAALTNIAGDYDSGANSFQETMLDPGTTTTYFQATDDDNSCNFTVSIAVTLTADNTDPMITCPGNFDVNNDTGVCGASITYNVTTSDNCTGETLAQTVGLASNTVFPIGTTTNTFVVTDASSRTATCSFTVKVTDAEDPTITCPSNFDVNNDTGVCGASVTYNVATSDNCTGETLAQTVGQASNTVFPIGTTTNTFVVTDASSRTATCSFTVKVTDAEDPTITCPSNFDVNNDTGVCGASVTYNVATSDNCTGETLAQTVGQASNTVFPIGTTTNTFVVTDASSRTATCSFTVKVTDAEDPKITCPSNFDIDNDMGVCGASVTYSVTTSDNCTGQTLNQTVGQASNTVFPIGTTTNTFVVTDASSRTATCSFTVKVTDAEDPTITCPGNFDVNNDTGVCGASVTYNVATSDNCTGETLAQTVGQASNTVFPIGTTTNTFVVTDASSRTATCSFTVKVTDAEDPTITCPSNFDVNNDTGVCGASVTYNVTTSDNCTGETLAQTVGQASNTVFPIGTTTNTFVVTDASSRTATCSFTVKVTDAEDPTITCPSNFDINNDTGVCGASVTYNVATSDNCTGQTLNQTVGQASNTVFPIGTTTNTFVVTDASSRTATCSFTVKVTDAEKPTVTCPSNFDVNNDTGVCGASVTYNVTTNDNCIGETLAQTAGQASNAVFPIGTTTNTFVVTDASNNTASCSFTVKVTDSEKPTVTCQDATLALVNGTITVTEADVVASKADNCGAPSIMFSQSVFKCEEQGDHLITVTATDNYGNTAECEATVTITYFSELNISDVSKLESSNGSYTPFVFKVTRSENSCSVAVDYETADGTATTADGDYTMKSGTVTFNAGGGSNRYVVILVDADKKVELDENYFVNLSNAVGGSVIGDGEGEGTIVNDDAASLSVNDVSAAEDGGSLTFTVTLDEAVQDGLSVDIATADNTATTGDNDYNSNSETLNFVGNKGEEQTFTVTLNPDTKVELDEIFYANLSNLQAGGANVSIADGQGEGTIENDDSANLSIDDVTMVEGTGGTTTNFTFTVTLDNNLDAGINVDFATADNTATLTGADYNTNSGTLNFAGNIGEQKMLTIEVNQDCYYESDESFFVNLSNIQAGGRNVQLSDGQGAGFITNDDTEAAISGCPTGYDVEVDSNCEFILLDYTNIPTASGACGGFSINQSIAPGNGIGLGTTNIILTASDAAGNTASCNFDIQVSDAAAPTANCQDAIVWLASNGFTSVAASQINNNSTDNCGVTNLSLSQTLFDCTNIGDNTVTLTVSDAANNTSQCTATVSIVGIAATCYLDADGDGYGDLANTETFCFACGTGYVDNSEDCDDSDASLNPGNTEICDGIDNNCDGQIDEGFDADMDGYTTCMGDCDDTNSAVNPAATEICDGLDNNCDGQTDEGFDADMDGYSSCMGDCDDSDGSINPGAVEVCDNIDNNCDGIIDEGFDADGDGFTTCNGDCDDTDAAINPLAIEICDGIDNDCNGLIDDGVSGTFTGNVMLLSQAMVDAFNTCITVIDGDLTVYGAGITDLNALGNLVEVTGSVSVTGTGITDLIGLDNVGTIGNGLAISQNNTLTDLLDLTALNSFAGLLSITQNALLLDLQGLEGITAVSTSLLVYANGSMTSLAGLDNVTTVTGNLAILLNSILTDCCPIYDLLNNGGVTGSNTIFGNDTGCESTTAINNACAPASPLANGGGIENSANEISENLEAYPNPTTGDLNLKWNKFDTEILPQGYRILNTLGMEVQKGVLTNPDQIIQVYNLKAGLYFIQLENKTKEKIVTSFIKVE